MIFEQAPRPAFRIGEQSDRLVDCAGVVAVVGDVAVVVPRLAIEPV